MHTQQIMPESRETPYLGGLYGYTLYRSLAQVTKWVRLKFAAMNLKKLAIHLRKEHQPPLDYTIFIHFVLHNLVFA